MPRDEIEQAQAGDPSHESSQPPFEALDFLYMPSSDVARDLAFYTELLGGRVVFAIEAIGTRVAEVELSRESPRLLLADHLGGDAPLLVHRVRSIEATLKRLEHSGVELEARMEIPQGPCCTLRSPGGQRLALYELTRPEVNRSFEGRRDF
jgi:hypothetical protein